jgi:hypothetical protein
MMMTTEYRVVTSGSLLRIHLILSRFGQHFFSKDRSRQEDLKKGHELEFSFKSYLSLYGSLRPNSFLVKQVTRNKVITP